MKNRNLLFILLIGLSLVSNAQTVTIGSQVWMTKNLDVTKFRNGDPIPEAKTVEDWVKAGENKQPAWCYYINDATKGAKYGKLYNWYAVTDPRGLAPKGFHIPTETEWYTLTEFLEVQAGKKMKSTSGWDSFTTDVSKTCPNCVNWNDEYRKVHCHTCKGTGKIRGKVTNSGNGSNTCGFSGLPGGFRYGDGLFYGVGIHGSWWSSTEGDTDDSYSRSIFNNNVGILVGFNAKDKGFSVRCLRD